MLNAYAACILPGICQPDRQDEAALAYAALFQKKSPSTLPCVTWARPYSKCFPMQRVTGFK